MKVVIDMGYCSLACFQKRGSKFQKWPFLFLFIESLFPIILMGLVVMWYCDVANSEYLFSCEKIEFNLNLQETIHNYFRH